MFVPYVQVERDIGNGVTVTDWAVDTTALKSLGLLTQSPAANPVTGVRPPLAIPVKPVALSSPQYGVTQTTPGSTEAPGYRVHNVSVSDGIAFQDGELELHTTGPIRPTTTAGWTNSDGARVADGNCAYAASSGSGYSTALTLSGFDFNIPENAIISGVKVTVKRRLV